MQPSNQKGRYLILGRGYVGTHLIHQNRNKNVTLLSTSRTNHDCIHFELQNPSTWTNLPTVEGTFWTFPAQPYEEVSEFLKSYKDRLGRIVVIGSTRSYCVHQNEQAIHEESPVDGSISRVAGENLICSHEGICVAAAGIYGPGRSPLDWIRRGKVKYSNRYVNLIHVEDLCRILWAAMHLGSPRKRYIAADQSPIRWSTLIDSWVTKYGLVMPEPATSEKISMKVNSSRTLLDLNVTLKYPTVLDVY